METINITTSQHVNIDYPVAGLGERIAARLIDLAAFFGLFLLLMLFNALTNASTVQNLFAIVFGIYGATYVFYNLICEVFMDGQSIGKRIMKIKVISLDGGQASMGQYFIRWLFRLADFVLTAQVGGLILVALTEKKQRLGDIVAGTTLIKTESQTPITQIAFQTEEIADYIPVFPVVHQLSDRDIELIHEVITTYYKTYNHDLVYAMSAKISAHLSVNLPEGMNEMSFLKTVIKDYNHITSAAI